MIATMHDDNDDNDDDDDDYAGARGLVSEKKWQENNNMAFQPSAVGEKRRKQAK